jgi:MCP family monocarboxylic acid transporter-like MFS transporter 10
VAGGLLNLRAFKSAAYTIYCASAFAIFLGVYTGELHTLRDEFSGVIMRIPVSTVLTYASVSATSLGISQDFSYYFISIINASSLFGRFAAGSVSDRFGESIIYIYILTFIGSISHR